MEKIIFLDIDGVLNPTCYINALRSMDKISQNEIKSNDEYGELFFNQNCDALKKIINETNAKIVISSTWRKNGIEKMQAIWKHRNISGEIIGVTPIFSEHIKIEKEKNTNIISRGLEIDYWIKQNNFKGKYVIIDDTKDMLKEQEHLFVVTNGEVGLTLKDAEQAIKILNKKESSISL